MSGEMIPIPVADPLVTAWLDMSDFGNGKRVAAVAAGKLLWVEDLQAWAHYDGRRWSLERGAIEAQRIAHAVIGHIDREAQALGAIAEDAIALRERVGDWCGPDIAQKRVEALRGHAVKSGSASMTAGMLRQARSGLAVMSDDFDRDQLAYNTLSHTLRFVETRARDGTVGWRVRADPHDPDDRIMQIAEVDYDPAAKCPFWEARLAMLTPDADQLASLKVLYGYTLTALTSDQAFYVHQGKGGDGKSATHLALAGLHGDYYRHAGVKSFLQATNQKSGSEHRSDLVRLRGDIRFVTSDEPPPRSTFDGETLKQITGGLVTARGAHERTEVTFRPRLKLFIECNVIPRAPSDDKGFRRRFKLYMWRVSLADTPQGEMPIDAVLAKLEGERSGILNWLIAGALEWLATRKVPQPAAMADVLSDFWADSSPLLEWMGEWCDTSDPTAETPAKALYAHFKEWCEARGHETVMSTTLFGRALRDKQHPKRKDGRGNVLRRGIRLRADGVFGAEAGEAGAGAGPSPADWSADDRLSGDGRLAGDGEDDDMPP